MALYPDTLKKAHAEIDAVVGNTRLPTFEDRDALPYVNAIIKESLRWQHVGPSGKLNFSLCLIVIHLHTYAGVAHMSVQDDVYNGYFIPKGTVLIGNTW